MKKSHSTSAGKTSPFTNAKGQPLPGSIAEIVHIPVNGITQGMILRGARDTNPVLLFLHGGPGSPEYAFLRNYPTGLEQNFTVCWWDQRGSGLSYSPDIPPESMTLQQLVEDTIEVTHYLRQRFGQEKIYLMGHSWGTFLGMHTIQQQPGLYYAYMGIGQISNQMESEKAAHAYMMERAIATGDASLATKLSKYTITTPESLTPEYLHKVRGAALNKLGVGIAHKIKSAFTEMLVPFMACSEYTLKQKLEFGKSSKFSVEHLFGPVLLQDLSVEIPKVDIPVFIVHGIYDYQVSYTFAKEYFAVLQAPEKYFFTFKNSAHSPLAEEPEQFRKVLKKFKVYHT